MFHLIWNSNVLRSVLSRNRLSHVLEFFSCGDQLMHCHLKKLSSLNSFNFKFSISQYSKSIKFWHILRILQLIRDLSCLEHLSYSSTNTGKAIDPGRNVANTKSLTKIISKMTAVTSQEIIVVTWVLLHHLSNYLCNIFCAAFCCPHCDRLSKMMQRMHFGVVAFNSIPGAVRLVCEGPLQVIDLNSGMEDSTKFQRRTCVCQNLIEFLDALSLCHIVYVDAYHVPNAWGWM
mmetsp:Transcript_97272/g.169821  ORF Transcript_97272/g.169821 Transcript_97272/m.169821 type:complete len:232 (-) Transcript_97272:276-971(-)